MKKKECEKCKNNFRIMYRVQYKSDKIWVFLCNDCAIEVRSGAVPDVFVKDGNGKFEVSIAKAFDGLSIPYPRTEKNAPSFTKSFLKFFVQVVKKYSKPSKQVPSSSSASLNILISIEAMTSNPSAIFSLSVKGWFSTTYHALCTMLSASINALIILLFFVCNIRLELGADSQAVHAWLFNETDTRTCACTTAQRGVGGNAARDFVAQVGAP